MLKKMTSTFLAFSIFASPTVMADAELRPEAKVPELQVGIKPQNPIAPKELLFSYQVNNGDKMEHLAEEYGTTTLAITEANKLETDSLTEGQVIQIPISPAVYNKIQQKYQDLQKKDTQTKNEEINVPNQSKPALSGRVVKRTIRMEATAYGNNHSGGGPGNLTASGNRCHEEGKLGYRTVASNKIPRGTLVFVSGYSSAYLPKGGFYAKVEDTGAPFDIYMEHSEKSKAVNGFGRQMVNIKILG